MSAAGGALASLGGPQVAAVLVAGGLVAGALGGAVATSLTGPGTPATVSGELSVYPCPDAGPALAMVRDGQRLLATGRTADGTWLRIHFPDPGRGEAWVQAAPLTVKGTVESLPVAACGPELAVATPSVEPAESLTAVANNPPTPAPTPEATATPAPSPTPTPAPNSTPSLAALTASTSKISYDTGNYCPTAGHRVTFKVTATDAEGIVGVTLFWREPGAASYAQSAMSKSAGTVNSGTWQVTLDTVANGITSDGKLAYYALGTDTAGATRRLPVKGSSSITVAVCANTGPTITSAASSAGTTMRWDPLGVGWCTTATTITATVKDPDGVKSVTLFYRRPGSSTWFSKAMAGSSGGKYSARVTTEGDGITITKPPTGTLSWYVKAADDKDATSQTKTKSITVRRCDSEAGGGDGGSLNPYPMDYSYACDATATIPVALYAWDPDQPADGLKVVFYWTLTTTATPAPKLSGHMTANVSKGSYYQGTTRSFNGSDYYYATFTVYAVTTDQYGGTSRSATETYDVGYRCT